MYSTSKILVSFKSVYMGIFYDFFIAQIQLLLMSIVEEIVWHRQNRCENKLVIA